MKSRRKPIMRPMGWGSCSRCGVILDDFRVKATNDRGEVYFFCIDCAAEVGVLPRSVGGRI